MLGYRRQAERSDRLHTWERTRSRLSQSLCTQKCTETLYSSYWLSSSLLGEAHFYYCVNSACGGVHKDVHMRKHVEVNKQCYWVIYLLSLLRMFWGPGMMSYATIPALGRTGQIHEGPVLVARLELWVQTQWAKSLALPDSEQFSSGLPHACFSLERQKGWDPWYV